MHHAIMQSSHAAACGALEKYWHNGMNETCQRSLEQYQGKTQCRALMFEIAFPDFLRMRQEPVLQHENLPDRVRNAMRLLTGFVPNLFCYLDNFWEIFP